ncbi:MAG: HPt (histidine-containing phosphotransfer) domain-containing protein [Lysobacterales bacterium]|jgi:HPt (histidine-containing phosphotransfer) domain-containing protein
MSTKQKDTDQLDPASGNVEQIREILFGGHIRAFDERFDLVEAHLAKERDSLPAKRARISSCWHSIQNEGWSFQFLSDLKTQVHRLSGSAGSYGLISLGLAAKNLDKVLALETEIPSLNSSIPKLIEQLLLAFDQAIEFETSSAIN